MVEKTLVRAGDYVYNIEDPNDRHVVSEELEHFYKSDLSERLLDKKKYVLDDVHQVRKILSHYD
ncbi:hypothetical protein [Chryseosolibacter indicus]|uniref:Uncharacterized protein n=1 Tax=Chryseosolibacter indicus TaxID=2782351 RepID=A0ABS5VQH9_9BACT|nr:hypothetical protein [Chryseosolibacter indicus]MBT1703707.1 hypothetical protein [Chryseosolibacter indicus]